MSQELDDRVVHLLFSANRWEAIESMKKTLKAGTTLIVDRYAFSGIAYSAAKGLDLEWCRSPDIGLIKPDKVIYLSVNEQIMSERANYGNERYEKIDFQKRVHNIFLQLQEPYWQLKNPKMDIYVDNMKFIPQPISFPFTRDVFSKY
uniref:dTMP kinase n=1 Tax=Biomphalaria glabrata TaxID=6526 RepID=A0A2C9M839_BIOGL